MHFDLCVRSFWDLSVDRHTNDVTSKNVLLFCYVKLIDAMLLCVCSVIYLRRLLVWISVLPWAVSDVCHFFVLSMVWCHLWSFTEQIHGTMEFTYMYVSLFVSVQWWYINYALYYNAASLAWRIKMTHQIHIAGIPAQTSVKGIVKILWWVIFNLILNLIN